MKKITILTRTALLLASLATVAIAATAGAGLSVAPPVSQTVKSDEKKQTAERAQAGKDNAAAVMAFESELRKKLDNAEKPNMNGRFKADFQSLKQYKVPEWYQDAKFGIFIHWGIFCVPAINDCWYGYWMYRDREDLPGGLKDHPYAATRAQHLKSYGPTDKFGYKDLIPLFKAEHFDAAGWVTLFKQAGARYVVPVAEFHDLFLMYDSSLTEWNSVKMGPRRDVVGEMRKATLAQGLKFGVSSHRVFHQNEQYYLHNGKNDADNPEYWGLYGKPFSNPTVEDPLFIEETLCRTVELVNKYQPDLLWFDLGICKPQFRDFRQKIAAHYYNQAEAWGKPEVVLNYKGDSYPAEAGVLDLEASKMEAVHYPFWQTDMSISETWSYTSNERLKTSEQLVHTLIDIVSKNGSLLLNVAPCADGTISSGLQERLSEIGAWLHVNGEAIYGTRPFKNFGEGPTKSSSAMVQAFTGQDVRYTTKGKTLYAIFLGWPKDKVQLTLPTFKNTPKEAKVTLLGHDNPVSHQVENNKMTLGFPGIPADKRMCKYAWVVKIEGLEID